MGFEKAFNKFAKTGTSLNRGINKAIGKDVFKDIKPIEPERQYQPYESFPPYTEPEPAQWTPLNGEAKQFSLQGHSFSVSANFDTAMQYKGLFKESARYYADRFKFKYQCCVSDFDTLLHYFTDMYMEGLNPMLQRAYSLLLPFGIFNVDMASFTNKQINTFRKAIHSYEVMTGIEISKNQTAEQAGNMVGNSVHMYGGGFGMKGALKGMAQAEGFNLGMKALGKFVSHQSKMSPEEKARVYGAFKQDVFFEEVYHDYMNTFLTLMQTLSNNKVIEPINIAKTNEFNTMIQNLQNPMFPQEKIAESLIKVMTTYPFAIEGYQLMISKFGQTEEVNRISNYFMG